MTTLFREDGMTTVELVYRVNALVAEWQEATEARAQAQTANFAAGTALSKAEERVLLANRAWMQFLHGFDDSLPKEKE